MENVENNNEKYLVMRDDRKITGEELSLEEATKELQRWETILKRWPDRTKVRIVPVSSKS